MQPQFALAGEELRRCWGWLLFLGIVLILMGTVALGLPLLATISAVLIYGWVLLIGGVFEVVAAFGAQRWGGFFLHLLAGVIDVVLGGMFLRHPDQGAIVLTLFLAIGFLIGGVFRVAAAVSMRFPNWGWTVLSGFVTALAGALIWAQWPWDSWNIIGLFVGIQLLFYGWSAVMLALAAKSQPGATAAAP